MSEGFGGDQIIQGACTAAREPKTEPWDTVSWKQESAKVVQKKLPGLVQEISPAGFLEVKEQFPKEWLMELNATRAAKKRRRGKESLGLAI